MNKKITEKMPQVKDLRVAKIEELRGKTLKYIYLNKDSGLWGFEEDEIHFITSENEVYWMIHILDYGENVLIDDIEGNLDDIIDSPLLVAELITNREDAMHKKNDMLLSFTWSFYKFATIKGYVTIKWWGESNGYYSERVSFFKMSPQFASNFIKYVNLKKL